MFLRKIQKSVIVLLVSLLFLWIMGESSVYGEAADSVDGIWLESLEDLKESTKELIKANEQIESENKYLLDEKEKLQKQLDEAIEKGKDLSVEPERLNDLLFKVRCDAFMHDEPRRGHAHLTRDRDGAVRQLANRQIQVGVVKDYSRRLAAKLEPHPFECRGRRRHNRLTGAA